MADTRVKSRMNVQLCENYTGAPLYRFSSGPQKIKCPQRYNKEKTPIKKPCNIMLDPRVKHGIYGMDLGPRMREDPYYPCMEMIKKDPVCQLYLRGLNKKCKGFNNKKLIQSSKIHNRNDHVEEKQELATAKSTYFEKSHISCQTGSYVEILDEDLVFNTLETQTDPPADADIRQLGLVKERTPKSGEDKDTQILPEDFFVFEDFVAEAVGDVSLVVVEQALVELMMEHELEMLLDQQRAFDKRKAAELDRLKKLQKCQAAIIEEDDRHVREEKDKLAAAREAGEVTSVCLFVNHFFGDIIAATLKVVGGEENKKSAEEDEDSPFKQWLQLRTEQAVGRYVLSQSILDDIIRSAISTSKTDDENEMEAEDE